MAVPKIAWKNRFFSTGRRSGGNPSSPRARGQSTTQARTQRRQAMSAMGRLSAKTFATPTLAPTRIMANANWA